MRHLPNGGLRVEAPPELAATLAALLEAWRQSLRALPAGKRN
jgi:hypothetical protein